MAAWWAEQIPSGRLIVWPEDGLFGIMRRWREVLGAVVRSGAPAGGET